MNSKLIISIVGARPQFIKSAAISRYILESCESNSKLEEWIIHTGQHFDYEMSELFFKDLDIPIPKYNLSIGGGSHGQNTGKMLEQIEKILINDQPLGVLIYGDTDSTLAGALAAAKLNIPLFHVESGLRSFNRQMPEEKNRIIADHISDICFVPTKNAYKQLIKEGIPDERIILSGDVMVDSARIYGDKSNKTSNILDLLEIDKNKYKTILVTIHRAENTDNKERMISIFEALNEFAINNLDKYKVVLPLHPRTKKKLQQYSLFELTKNINITSPIGFLDIIYLQKTSSLIITDSGGIQKEAFIHGTPCLTIRTETEWTELINTGWNVLADPSSKDDILSKINIQLEFNCKSTRENLYGDGFSSKLIVESINNFLGYK